MALVHSWARVDRVLDALGKRISERGDMPIRVSRKTLEILRFASEIRRWEDPEPFREVDAMALQMLMINAKRGRINATTPAPAVDAVPVGEVTL